MGFSWAVYLAQQATTAAVVEATGIAESELFHDRQVNLSLEHGAWAFLTHELCLAVLRHLGDRTGR